MQVLGNLLSNAARHSPESSAIRVSAVRQGVHVAVSVADEGRGIPADRLPHLFRKFSRIDAEDQGATPASAWRSARGWWRLTGDASGPRAKGRAWARGSPSHFRRPERPRPLARRQSPVAPARLRDRAETDLAYWWWTTTLRRSGTCGTLSPRRGYSPTVTADPEEVPRLMEDEQPQLVLLDLMLPGTDGIVLMKSIREMADVPVIFISAYGQDQVIARAFDMGATDYVVKPFSPPELAARIRAALRRQAVPALDAPSEPYLLGGLTVDYAQRMVTVAGVPVDLTDTEYRMLAELSANAGRIMPMNSYFDGYGARTIREARARCGPS